MNSFLNKYSVKTKIIGIAVFFVILLLISSGYSLFSMAKVDKELKGIAEKQSISMLYNKAHRNKVRGIVGVLEREEYFISSAN